MSIYDTILANIDADKRAWCKGEWAETDDNGAAISRCLVEHVDLATGVSYIDNKGKVFVSKDPKRWRKRDKVLAELFALLPKKAQEDATYDAGVYEPLAPRAYTKDELIAERVGQPIYTGSEHLVRRPNSNVAEVLVSFNDLQSTTRARVRNLVKKAAKTYGGK